MSGEIIVLVTCPPNESASLASCLVTEGLAACVNIVGGITSVFFWEEKLNQEKEELLVIKSNRAIWSKLEARVKELHSYTVPEIIAFDIACGYKPYLEWVNKEVSKKT